MRKHEVAAILGARYDKATGCWWIPFDQVDESNGRMASLNIDFDSALQLIADRSRVEDNDDLEEKV